MIEMGRWLALFMPSEYIARKIDRDHAKFVENIKKETRKGSRKLRVFHYFAVMILTPGDFLARKFDKGSAEHSRLYVQTGYFMCKQQNLRLYVQSRSTDGGRIRLI